jgi:hypothetical protein
VPPVPPVLLVLLVLLVPVDELVGLPDEELVMPPWPPIPVVPVDVPPADPEPHAPMERNGPISAAASAAPSTVGLLARFEVFVSSEDVELMLAPW